MAAGTDICPAGRKVTYSNLFRLTKENGGKGRIYDFYRGEEWNPNFLVSDDDGDTWSYGGRLIASPGRPYVKYAGNGRDEYPLRVRRGAPAEFTPGTGIYHAYYKDGSLCRSDGRRSERWREGHCLARRRGFLPAIRRTLPGLRSAPRPRGRPFLAYSVSKDREGNDHRYRYARWDGSRWLDHEIAYAGSRLYRDEVHYTGLVTLNPQDPDEVFISTNADPASGRPLMSHADGRRHWEIFRGVTRARAATWTWTPVTTDSTADNLRPIMPIAVATTARCCCGSGAVIRSTANGRHRQWGNSDELRATY